MTAPLMPEDERLTLESETLAVVSSFGGERIIASPRMEAMVAQLADVTERSVARALDAERAGAGRLRAAAQAVLAHLDYESADDGTGVREWRHTQWPEAMERDVEQLRRAVKGEGQMGNDDTPVTRRRGPVEAMLDAVGDALAEHALAPSGQNRLREASEAFGAAMNAERVCATCGAPSAIGRGGLLRCAGCDLAPTFCTCDSCGVPTCPHGVHADMTCSPCGRIAADSNIPQPAHAITPECGPVCWTTGHHHDPEACDGCRRLADVAHSAGMALGAEPGQRLRSNVVMLKAAIPLATLGQDHAARAAGEPWREFFLRLGNVNAALDAEPGQPR